jgi:uncharacterized protein YuzE
MTSSEANKGKTNSKVKKKNVNIKFSFDEENDIIYISIKDGPAFDSEEVAENIRVEYDEQGELVGIEIFNITQIIANSIKKKIKETLFER